MRVLRESSFLVTIAAILTVFCITELSAADEAETAPLMFQSRLLENKADCSRLALSINEVKSMTVDLDGEERCLYSLGLDPTISQEGWPDLPFIARSVLVPPGTTIRIQVNNLDFHLEHNLPPVIAPREVGEEYLQVGEAVEYQQVQGFWPPEPVQLGEIAQFRGYRIANVRYYPIQYNRSTGETRLNDQFDVSVIYERDFENPDADSQPLPLTMFTYQALAQLVENPPPRPHRDELNTASYLYLVPEVDGIEEVLQPLFEWRQRQGHRVVIEYVENGASVATISDVIDTYYDSDDPIEYVALVGDTNGPICLSAATQYGDYRYALMDNDPLPDVAIGRISCDGMNVLERVVNKLVNYESNPYMQETRWFKHGGVVAGHIANGYSSVLVAKYVRREMLKLGYTEVRHWYHDEDGEIRGEQPFIAQTLDWGVSSFHYRAYSGMNGIDINVLYNLPNTRGRWPAVLAVSCNTGNFVDRDACSEAWFKSRGGGIGCISTATGGTSPPFNNMMAGGVWKAIYKDELFSFGWGLNGGKYALWQAYAGFDNRYLNFMDWNNLMGDPGTIIWTDIPEIITVDQIDEFPIGLNRFSLQVMAADDDRPIADALVCLYKEDDEFHLTKYSNENGRVEFYIEPGSLTPGELMVTVTKHNHKAILNEIEVVVPENFVGVSDWEIDDDAQGQSVGNNDGLVNPGERIEVNVVITNYGDQNPQGQAMITPLTLSPWVEVIGDPLVVNELPAAGQSLERTILLQVHPASPDESTLLVGVGINSEQNHWNSLITLHVAAPAIEIEEVDVIAGVLLEPGQVKQIEITVRNRGQIDLPPTTATLISENELLRVINPVAHYGLIRDNRTARIDGDRFRLSAHPYTIPGSEVPLILILETEAGFIDSTRFIMSIGEKNVDDPLGPDDYGYICLDSGDDSWEFCPEFDWIEIDPDLQNFDLRGTELNLRDTGDNLDCSEAVELPFDFQYYGEIFDVITISSNGWASFGDQSELADFRNRRIGQALGPDAQLCVWWDNLIVQNQSAILWAYDRNQGLFIIEWSNVRRLLDGGGAGATETFQIILYDPAEHPTETGDGMIKFQYLDIENQGIPAHNDTPYCTIGISDLNDLDGIEYTYWNTYPPGAREIEDQMALLFITQTDFRTGVLIGTITDVATGQPVPNAEIITSRGFWGEADAEGHYIIDNILVRDDYDVTAFALGWNDSTLSEIDIAEEETLRVDFSLLHPEFAANVEELSSMLFIDETFDLDFSVTNNGNGPLVWSVHRELPGGEGPEPWALRRAYPLGESLDDSKISGVVFTEDRFYIARSNDQDPVITVLDREGEFIEEFPQPENESRYGMKDLAFDGELLWGSGHSMIFGQNLEGELVRQFDGPFNPNSNLAWDSDRELLWVSSITSDIAGVDRDGNQIIELDHQGLRQYGLAYYPDDIDGYPLYIFAKLVDRGDQLVFKMNPDTEDTMFVRQLNPELENASAQACFISNEYDVYSWVFMSIYNEGRNDGLELWQLDIRRDWYQINPMTGVLQTEEAQDFVVTLDATNLPQVDFVGDLCFSHNADDGETRIPVTLEVVAGAGHPENRTLFLEEGWNLVSLNIIPDEVGLRDLFRPLAQAGVLNMIKDGAGRFYRPAEDFNNIPEWFAESGYQINVSAANEYVIHGVTVDVEAPIQLTEGWNMTSYYPRETIDAELTLSGIIDQLIIVKDGWGRFYFPEFNFNSLGTMSQGHGYQFKVSEDVGLVYTRLPDEPDFRSVPVETPPQHFSSVCSGQSNMSVLLTTSESGRNEEIYKLSDFELGIFAGDRLIGSGTFNSVGQCGVPVWGDDPLTQAAEGATTGEQLQFRLWDGTQEHEVHPQPIHGSLSWSENGIFVGELDLNQGLPVEFGISAAYPNPFNSSIHFTYGLNQIDQVALEIFDLNGRLIESITLGAQQSGWHQLTWQAGGTPSGIYFAQIRTSHQTSLKKITLMK